MPSRLQIISNALGALVANWLSSLFSFEFGLSILAIWCVVLAYQVVVSEVFKEWAWRSEWKIFGRRTRRMAVYTIASFVGLTVALGLVRFSEWQHSRGKTTENPPSAQPQKALSAQEIAQELRGGNNFCYFALNSIDHKPQAIDGKYQLQMIGVGVVEKVNYWISPAGVLPTGKPNDPYYSIDASKPLIEIVHEGGRAWEKALPIGEYRIDFAAKNGNWYERLKIYMSNGEVRHSIKVTKELDAGDVLYDSEKKQ